MSSVEPEGTHVLVLFEVLYESVCSLSFAFYYHDSIFRQKNDLGEKGFIWCIIPGCIHLYGSDSRERSWTHSGLQTVRDYRTLEHSFMLLGVLTGHLPSTDTLMSLVRSVSSVGCWGGRSCGV